jgi:hypothetical protein
MRRVRITKKRLHSKKKSIGNHKRGDRTAEKAHIHTYTHTHKERLPRKEENFTAPSSKPSSSGMGREEVEATTIKKIRQTK